MIPELINNFELVSYATHMIKNPSFHPKINLLIHQILCPKSQALPASINSNVQFHLARETPVKFLHVTEYLETTYGNGHFTYYSQCFVKGVPFQVHSPINKQVDDSALVYVDDSKNLHLGIIVGIVKLKSSSEVLFIIGKAKANGYDSFLLHGMGYKNDCFVYATFENPPQTVSINYKSIKEKVAYRLDDSHNSICEFHLFPNLLEST